MRTKCGFPAEKCQCHSPRKCQQRAQEKWPASPLPLLKGMDEEWEFLTKEGEPKTAILKEYVDDKVEYLVAEDGVLRTAKVDSSDVTTRAARAEAKPKNADAQTQTERTRAEAPADEPPPTGQSVPWARIRMQPRPARTACPGCCLCRSLPESPSMYSREYALSPTATAIDQ